MRKLIYVLLMSVVFTGFLSAGVTHEYQLYVKKSYGTSEQQAISTLSEESGTVIVDFNVLDWACAEFDTGKDMTKVISNLEKTDEFDNVVTRVEPDLLSTPNDTYYDLQWYLSNDGSIQGATQDADIDADEAWDYETGSSSTKIGILDTGIPTEVYHGHGWPLLHPELDNSSRVILGWEDFRESLRWRDQIGHGTHIAGIIGAETDNSSGIAGLDRNAQLYISQVAAPSAIWPFVQFSDDLQGAIIDAVDAGCQILNISWGADDNDFGASIEPAIDYAYDNDVLVVCAAGNDGNSAAIWPAAFAYAGDIDGTHPGFSNGYSNVISVGATDVSDHRVPYSNYGDHITFAAPGGEGTPGGVNVGDESAIFSTYPTLGLNIYWDIDTGDSPGYIFWKGTSMATPVVAGVAGLVHAKFPQATAEDIRDYLIASCEKVGGYTYGQDGRSTALGYGRVNAFYAVAPPDAPQNISGGYQSGHPHISWDANSEPDLVGYHVYRMDPNDQVDQLTANPIEDTEYTDTELGQGYAVEYWYWVTAVDVSEQESDASDDVLIWTGPLNKELAQNIPDGIPAEYGFSQNYPNPFNPATTIRFGLPEAGVVKLTIYDIQGKPVRTLINRHLPAGYQSIVWQGQNDTGQQMSTGVYFARLEVNGFSQTHKMILMK